MRVYERMSQTYSLYLVFMNFEIVSKEYLTFKFSDTPFIHLKGHTHFSEKAEGNKALF